MGVLNYILVSVITALALPVGASLAKIAKEELKQGMKYIEPLFPGSLAVVALFTALPVTNNIIATLVAIATFLIFYFKKINNYVLYIILALVFLFNQNSEFFIPFACFLFIANLLKGTELYTQENTAKNLAYLMLLFLALTNLPLFFIYP